MNEDLLEIISALRLQKEMLEAYVSKTVDNLIQDRKKQLAAEVDMTNEQVKEIVEKNLEEFRNVTVKMLLQNETQQIDEKIRIYSERLVTQGEKP